MAQYLDDFEDQTAGTAASPVTPTGWTARWTNDWFVSDDHTADKALEPADASDAEYLLSFDAVGSPAGDHQVMAYVLQRYNGLNFHIAARAGGAAGSENCYALAYEAVGNQLRLYELASGTRHIRNSAAVGATIPGDFYFRMQIEVDTPTEGDVTVRGKMWGGAEDDEPGGWQVNYADTTPPAAGWAGAMAVFYGSGNNTSPKHWVSVGTDGDPAPFPGFDDGPDTPTLTADDETLDGVTLSTDTYSGTDPHDETQWQVDTDNAFPSPVVDVTSGVALEEYDVTGLDDGTTYYARARWKDDLDVWGDWSNIVEFTTLAVPTFGDAPDIFVGPLTDTTVTVATDPLSEYLTVEYFLLDSGGSPITSSGVLTGSGRFSHEFTGLTASTTYQTYLQVTRAAGLAPDSETIEFTTLSGPIDDDCIPDCPPAPLPYLWNPDSNPGDCPTWRGTGFYTPYPGEPLRGEVTCSFRWPFSQTWDIEISDDNGATWSTLENGVTQAYGDADLLEVHEFELDTTSYTDGQDFMLRATSGTDVVESCAFAIDNAGDMATWSSREGVIDPADWGVMWNTGKTGGIYGTVSPEFGSRIWFEGTRGHEIIASKGHPFSAYVRRDVDESYGADATTRIYLWSGEGGSFGLQGGRDIDGVRVGLGFMIGGINSLDPVDADGVGEDQTGIMVFLEVLTSTTVGCCDDHITSVTSNVSVEGRPTASDPWEALDVEGGGNTSFAYDIPKVYGTSFHAPPRFPLPLTRYQFRTTGDEVGWRDGHLPGALPDEAVTCGRRYSMYTLRSRVEVDGADRTRARIRIRLDGPGVEPPGSGYWHYDEWTVAPNEWTPGANGLASFQHERSTWGAHNGNRNFTAYSVLPLEPDDLPDVPPDEPPQIYPTFEGEPCTLILQVFEPDRETIAWEVGTDPDHENPWLCEPDSYGEQEIDVIQGSASIGQVEVCVIDKAETPGDQNSGYVTARLVDGGINAIHGRRCRLIRFIDVDPFFYVIADGPANTPRLDESFAGYRWTIRDTRDTERRKRAFTKGVTSIGSPWAFPMGTESGFGAYVDPDTSTDEWLVPPTDPLIGDVYAGTGGTGRLGVLLPDYWTGGLPIGVGAETCEPGVAITEEVFQALWSPELVIEAGIAYWTWPDFEILWRIEASGDPWTVIQPSDAEKVSVWDTPAAFDGVVPAMAYGASRGLVEAYGRDNITLVDGSEIGYGVVLMMLRGTTATGDFPVATDSVEIAIRYKGEPSESFPHYVEFDEFGEQITIGGFLRDLYDGVYSTRDPVTDELVPTGIRYDRADLLAMTDPIRLRLTEKIEDVRDWAEKYGYQPTGYAPALNRYLYISPVSQIPPASFDAVTVIDDAVTEAVPNWNGGEEIVNILSFTYPRWHPLTSDEGRYVSAASDGLKAREIIIEYRDEASISAHTEQRVAIDGQAFSAVGLGEVDDGNSAASLGLSAIGLENETGYLLAVDRRIYVFDRYKNGAQAVRIPVKREHVAELRAGDWVVVDLTWIPDYILRRRGGVFSGQILAIEDLDCAWRMLFIDEALPVEAS